MRAMTIGPRDPLLFRDGRPYGADSYSVANSLPWPFPSTVYGALRTAIGRTDATTWQAMVGGRAQFGGAVADVVGSRAEIGSLHLRGPLLSYRGELCVPAPADVELHRAGHQLLAEVRTPDRAAAFTDPCLGRAPVRLAAMVPPAGAASRPVTASHPWWPWQLFERLLATGSVHHADRADLVRRPPAYSVRLPEVTPVQEDRRVHIATRRAADARLGARPRTAERGMLFQTVRLAFDPDARLAIWVSGDRGLAPQGWLTLGGERVGAELTPKGHPAPPLPAAVLANILASRAFSLRLLTPAVLGHGWAPGWLSAQGGRATGVVPGHDGVRLELEAACVGRYQPLSGVALGRGGDARARGARRAAPAGSVWFLRANEATDEALEALVRGLWWSNLADDPGDCARGFGLVTVGAGLPNE